MKERGGDNNRNLGLTSLLHEGKEFIQEFPPRWIVIYFVELKKETHMSYGHKGERNLTATLTAHTNANV